MKLKHAGVLAAAASAVLIAGPAFAAGPPYTVTVGTNTSGTYSISAASSGGVSFSAKNNAGTTINMNCTSVSGTGSVTAGASKNPVATIGSTTWSGCTIPGGAATVGQVGTWNVTGTGSNATSGSETIAGNVGNVEATVATTASASICSFTVKGSLSTAKGLANGSFDEATQTLAVSETGYTGNLKLWNVSGCLGQLQNGNPANFAANLVVTSPSGAINLS